MGAFDRFGPVNHQPFYNAEESVDPETGRYSRRLTRAGGITTVNPFTSTFGNSVGVMQGLGNTIGGAFGAVNGANLMSAEKARDRAYFGDLLRQMMGGFGGGQGSGYRDTMSRQASGGGQPGQMSAMIRSGFYGAR